jgi:hypothetical protein
MAAHPAISAVIGISEGIAVRIDPGDRVHHMAPPDDHKLQTKHLRKVTSDLFLQALGEIVEMVRTGRASPDWASCIIRAEVDWCLTQ